MSLEEVYDNDDICRIEEKFALIEIEGKPTEGKVIHNYIGKYPLEPFRDGGRGTYGGELVCQGILAAWASISDPDMSPHSMHSYFAKAGSDESPLRWEVQEINNGKRYANRLAMGYQSHTNVLVYIIQVSFVKHNSFEQRKQLTNEKRLKFQKQPQQFFYKYKDRLDDMNYIQHTHDFLLNIVPPEYLEPTYGVNFDTRGSSEFGFFVKFNDNLDNVKDLQKTKLTQLAYISDSFYLGTIIKALGLPIIGRKFDHFEFFRVSLDHAIYFHDNDYDPNEWLFIDYRFSNFNNDRVLCQCSIFTLQGKMVASIVQEGLVYFKDHFYNAIEEGINKDANHTQSKL